MLFPREFLLPLLIWSSSCAPRVEEPPFPGLVPFVVEPVSLQVALDYCTWLNTENPMIFSSPGRPHPLGDVNGDGTGDFAAAEQAELESGITFRVRDGKTKEILRTHPGTPWNHQPVIALPDLDGDGCAEYLLRIVTRVPGSSWQTQRVDVLTVSGRTGDPLAQRSWETPTHSPRLQGVFTIAGEGDRPLLLAYGRRSRPRSAFRKGPRHTIVEPYAFLIDPLDLEPVRFFQWKSFPKALSALHAWCDWTGNGVAEGVAFSYGGLELRSTTDGERLLREEARIESERVENRWDGPQISYGLVGSRMVFAGPGDGAVCAYRVGTGELSYMRSLPGYGFCSFHGIVPVLDADGDDACDFRAAVKVFRRYPGRLSLEFVTISGATGEILQAF